MGMEGAFKVDTSKKFTFKLLVRQNEDNISIVEAKLRDAGFDKITVVNDRSRGIVDVRNAYNIEVVERLDTVKDAFLMLDKIITISDRKVVNNEILVG